MYASVIKNEINKKCSCRPANLIRLRRHFLVTRFTMFRYYHVVIKQTICGCRELLHAVGIYTFFRRRFECALLRLHIMPSAIRLYTHTCACPNNAAQMYFSSMNSDSIPSRASSSMDLMVAVPCGLTLQICLIIALSFR